jgi:hypothetical protein
MTSMAMIEAERQESAVEVAMENGRRKRIMPAQTSTMPMTWACQRRPTASTVSSPSNSTR